MRYNLYFLIGITILTCCGNPKPTNYEIDQSIVKEVELRISASEIAANFSGTARYDNTLIVEYYVNDSLDVSIIEGEKKDFFNSYYYDLGDTIGIDGYYGMFGGFGFSVELHNGKATVYHLVASDDYPAFSLNETGDFELRLKVPCVSSRLILSEEPELVDGGIIYGLVEFKSGNYYQAGEIMGPIGEELEPRNKTRMNMKIYFKSIYFDFDEMD